MSATNLLKNTVLEMMGAFASNRFVIDRIGRFQNSYHILTYHRVLPQSDPLAMACVDLRTFSAQMKLLSKCYHVVSLETLLENLERKKITPNTICITFDDGYRDNFEYAFPVLKALRLPATLFLATDFIGTGKILWYDRVLQAFKNCRLEYFSLPEADIEKHAVDALINGNHIAFKVLEWLKGFSPVERNQKITALFNILELENEPECDLMLSWDQVRLMQSQGMAFGAHTCSHPILSTINLEENEFEILQSQIKLENELSKPCQLFAYPNGRKGDYAEPAKTALKKGRFRCALTTNPGVNKIGEDEFEIKRIQPWETSINRFQARMLLEKTFG